jgi:transcriptional regulator of nitric oxide reductase
MKLVEGVLQPSSTSEEGRLRQEYPSQSWTITTMEKESEILLAGVKLVCKHCSHDRFNIRNALLNTKVLTFFEADWLANTAEVFVCTRCGFLHWVLPPDPGAIEKKNPA